MVHTPSSPFELDTPYFKRSISFKQDNSILERESTIDAWLSQRDVRFVTTEGIEYERRRNRLCLSIKTECDSADDFFSATSSPCKMEPLLSLRDNIMFMRRKQSTR